MGYSGAGGKLIHEKNQKQKISWHCPFKVNLKANVYIYETALMVYLGAWGNWFMKKTRSRQSRVTVSLKVHKGP